MDSLFDDAVRQVLLAGDRPVTFGSPIITRNGSYIALALAANFGIPLALTTALSIGVAGSLITTQQYYEGKVECLACVTNSSVGARDIGFLLSVYRTSDSAIIVEIPFSKRFYAGTTESAYFSGLIDTFGAANNALYANIAVQLQVIALQGAASDCSLITSLPWTTASAVTGIRLQLAPGILGNRNI